MKFNKHDDLVGLHAAFGASKHTWLRYDDDHAVEVFNNLKAAELGTRLHAWVEETIKLGIKQRESTDTLSAYVNDAIGYGMNPEVILYYSPRFFGTADAISFENNQLRIHDLKTGRIPGSLEQLEIYAALFCLEYDIKPELIGIELRIYQANEVNIFNPDGNDIREVMNKIVHLDKLLLKIENGALK